MQNWASSAQNLERVGNSLWSGANLQLIKKASRPGKHSTQVTTDGQQEVKKCSWKVGGLGRWAACLAEKHVGKCFNWELGPRDRMPLTRQE